MSVREYIGARYVPIFGRKNEESILWDNSAPYEPLTIVLHNGNSYTSRQYVPIGIDISNEIYWALTGNYNAQVEQYRTEVNSFNNRITENSNNINAINGIIPANDFSTTNTVKNYIDSNIGNVTNDIANITGDIDGLNDAIDGLDDAISAITTNFNVYIRQINTTADFSTLEASNNIIVKTMGFHTAGDGGAAYYKIVNNGTANNITSFACSNNFIAELIVPAIVNANMYGAYGNGVNDDTIAIQYCLNSGKKIVLNKATYLINETIYIPNENNFYLDGSGCTFIWSGITTNSFISVFNNAAINNVVIKNCTFNYNNTGSAVYGIYFMSCSNITIQACYFKNISGSCTRIHNCTNVTIRDCSFNDITGATGVPGEGIYGQNFVNLIIDNCRADNIADHFIYCDGENTANKIIINNCEITNCGVDTVTNGAAIALYSNVRYANISNIVGVTIKALFYIGIHGSITTAPNEINIKNCIANNCRENGFTIMGPTDGAITRINISDCILTNVSQDAFQIRYARYINVNNCTIQGAGRSGIQLSAARYCTFNNISIQGNYNVGIMLSFSSLPVSIYNAFSNIVFIGNSATYGVQVRANNNYNLFNGLVFDGTFTYKMENTGTGNVFDNVING